MEATVARIAAGEPVPHCLAPGCGGVLKPDTISFGQRLVRANITRARQWLDECDLLIVMGTSLRCVLPQFTVQFTILVDTDHTTHNTQMMMILGWRR
jgi:NAD-dependent SIR2 family protein deacetylase